jgi:dihydroxyacid dehydratase/phosphogluconate dehydratase
MPGLLRQSNHADERSVRPGCLTGTWALSALLATYGITKEELMSGKPMIGIAQTGSDIAPCNRHHIEAQYLSPSEQFQSSAYQT